MAIFKKLILVLIAFILVLPFTFLPASAAEDFTMKSFDKGYVTFIFDDGRMPFTKEVAELFQEFGMPMSCAIVANRVQKDSEIHKILLSVQQNGGEILSHGYNHRSITSQELSIKNNAIYELKDIEYELGNSWKRLTNLGFNVNGYIETGCGGDEKTADYALVETVARKYYKYSNAAGVSAQYTQDRRFMNWDTFDKLKERIDKAAEAHEWIILSAHGYNEISSDRATPDDMRLRQLLNYIKNMNGEVEVVTWNYIYNNFGEYTGAAAPTTEALEFLNVTDNDDPETLSKNAYVEEPVTDNTSSQNSSSSNISSESTVSSENESETVSSEESPTQSQTTVSEETPVVEAETVEKTNIGKYIAIGVACAIALASVAAAVIVFLKFK